MSAMDYLRVILFYKLKYNSVFKQKYKLILAKFSYVGTPGFFLFEIRVMSL